MVFLAGQGGGRGEDILEYHVEARRHATHQRVRQAPQNGRLTVSQELVENDDLTSRADDAGDFAEAAFRLRYHGQNQVQDGAVEAGIGEGQAMHIAPYRQEVEVLGARQGATQHRLTEVYSDIAVLRGQVRQIEAGADTGQQNPAAVSGQAGQTAPARGPGCPVDRRIVKRGDQRVAVLEAQCRTLGMASVNSGISASKWVPSSATIW